MDLQTLISVKSDVDKEFIDVTISGVKLVTQIEFLQMVEQLKILQKRVWELEGKIK